MESSLGDFISRLFGKKDAGRRASFALAAILQEVAGERIHHPILQEFGQRIDQETQKGTALLTSREYNEAMGN